MGGSFILIVLITTFLIPRYLQPKEKTDNLIEFVPAETIIYSHFYFNQETPLKKKIIEALFNDLPNWLELKEIELKEDILSNLNQELALAFIPDEKLNLKPLLIIKLKADKATLQGLTSSNYFFIPKQSLLFIIDQKVKEGMFNLDPQKNLLIPIHKFDSNNYFSVENQHFNQTFINLDWFKNNQLNLGQKILTNFLNKNGLKKLLLKTDILNDQLLINIITSPSLLPEENSNRLTNPLIDNLPNTILLYLRGNTDQDLNNLIKQFIISQNYRDIGSMLLTLFSDSQEELLINLEENKKLTYLLISTSQPESAKKVENIKLAISQYLTSNLPKEKEKILPDKTKVVELIAEPERFEFQKLILNNNQSDGSARLITNLYSLSVPEINLEIVLGIYKDKLILGNSKKIFENLTSNINNNQISINKLLTSCNLRLNTKQLFFLNPKLLYNLLNLNQIPPIYFKLFDKFILEFEENYLKSCLK